MARIKVIGAGPGGKDYLLPVAQKALEEAEILVGGKRVLAPFQALQKKEVHVDGDLRRAVEFLRQNKNQKIAVLVSGDPGLYSLLDYLLKHFRPEEVEVVPGISAFQVAFARAKMTWQDAVIISLHGRRHAQVMAEKVLPAVREKAKVALFTDRDYPPWKIAADLLRHGVTGKKMCVGDNLSCPEERWTAAGLEETAAKQEEFNNCVVLIVEG